MMHGYEALLIAAGFAVLAGMAGLVLRRDLARRRESRPPAQPPIGPVPDIEYVPYTESVLFSAGTPLGRKWMGAASLFKPLEQAEEYRRAARQAGLIVTEAL